MNTFDLLGTMQLTADASVVVATLATALTAASRRRSGVIIAFAVWFALITAFAAMGGFDSRFGPGFRWIGVAVGLPVLALTWAGFRIDRFRTAIASIPLAVLVRLHSVRVLGVLFVILYSFHRLAAPFAPTAGWGDMFIGSTAWLVTLGLARWPNAFRRWALAWNTLGALDLITAIFLGVTSAPGTPFQIFTAEPGSRIMGNLPWILIPGFLVPILLLTHFAIYAKLRTRTQ